MVFCAFARRLLCLLRCLYLILITLAGWRSVDGAVEYIHVISDSSRARDTLVQKELRARCRTYQQNEMIRPREGPVNGFFKGSKGPPDHEEVLKPDLIR